MNNWISIKDKLPANNRNVLTIADGFIYWIGWFDLKSNDWMTYDTNNSDKEINIDVDYWMELPLPPE